MPRPKKPKVTIRRERTSLGWAYVIRVDGMYVGTGLTKGSARESVPRVLAIYEKVKRRGQ
jgi:hypothetical protein